MSIRLSTNTSDVPIMDIEELAKKAHALPDRLRESLAIANGISVSQPSPTPNSDYVTPIKMDCDEGLSDIEKVNCIFGLTNKERFERVKAIPLHSSYGTVEKIYNIAMNLLLFEQEVMDAILGLFEKELEAYHLVEKRLNYVPEHPGMANVGQNGQINLPVGSPEALQLYRTTHVFLQDSVSALSGIIMRKISEKEERAISLYCQSHDKPLSDLANIIVCTSQLRKICTEIDEKWIKPPFNKARLLNEFCLKNQKANQVIFTYLVPRLLMIVQKMIYVHSITIGNPRKLSDVPLFQGVVDLIKGTEGKKSVQREIYALFDETLNDIAQSQKQRGAKLEILKLRWSRNEELFPSITEPLPSAENFLVDPEIVIEKAISPSQHKKKKPIHAKQKKSSTPVKKSEKSSAPEPLQESSPPPLIPKEEWLSMPLHFVYGERVRRWFSVPKGGGAPYATFPIASSGEGERVRIHHSFSRQVDKVIHLSQYVHKDKQGERLYAVAQMSYPDGSYDQGVIGWGLTQRESGLECYHRYFTKRDTQELIDENIQKIFYQIDFPSLSEAVLPPAEELLQEEGTTTAFRSEALGILHFDDRYNGVRVSVLPLQNKL